MKSKKSDDIILTFTDPQGRKITLSEERIEHLKDHPEIKINEVKTTVTSPEFITENLNRKSVAYTTMRNSFLYVNVYAGIVGENEGYIRTAFLERKMPKGEIIYDGYNKKRNKK